MSGIDYVMQRAVIPGWFSVVDGLTLVAIDEEQRQGGVFGDILEVGAYLGKSAILLGYLLRARERLVVVDLFEEPAASKEQRVEQRAYRGLTQLAFEKNYARFHSTRPIVLRGASDHHLPSLASQSFRLIHVDGAHEHETVRGDLAQATRLVRANGLVVMDDIISDHTPGVAAAAWEAVARGQLVPLIQTGKLYTTVPDSHITADTLAVRLARFGVDVIAVHTVYGHPILQLRAPGNSESLGRRLLKNTVPPGAVKLTRRLQRLARTDRLQTWLSVFGKQNLGSEGYWRSS
jgi:predicted O-methyltransferase YrrM